MTNVVEVTKVGATDLCTTHIRTIIINYYNLNNSTWYIHKYKICFNSSKLIEIIQ